MHDPRQLGEELFLQHLEEVECILQRVTARRRSTPEEAQELYGLVMLKLIEDDYAVLRNFRGASSWSTYLTVVIQRQLLDLRTKEWGRWRPSATARRLGCLAVELERRLECDGLEPTVALQQMLMAGMARTAVELEELLAQLPRRRRGAKVAGLKIDELAGDGLAGDGLAGDELGGEGATALAPTAGRHVELPSAAMMRRQAVAELSDVLYGALGDLSQQEQTLLRLRFGEGWTVRRIALQQGAKERPLYRRFQSILRRLRRVLEGRGLNWQDIVIGLDGHRADLDLDLGH